MAEQTKHQVDPTAQAITQGIAQGLSELAKSLKPQGPLEQAGLSPERIKEITLPPAPQRYRDIPWRSEETEATGIAHVVESKKFPNGRIVQISGYTHPETAYQYESQGGKVPDGFSIWSGQPRTLTPGQEPSQGDLNPGFLQWRYETFYRADLRHYIGREIKAHHCQDPKGLETKWLEGKVGGVHE